MEFLSKLRVFEVNGTTISNENEVSYQHLNSILLKMENLQDLILVGAGIAENFNEILVPLKSANLQSLDLQYNGISHYCFSTYFRHLVNFETI